MRELTDFTRFFWFQVVMMHMINGQVGTVWEVVKHDFYYLVRI